MVFLKWVLLAENEIYGIKARAHGCGIDMKCFTCSDIRTSAVVKKFRWKHRGSIVNFKTSTLVSLVTMYRNVLTGYTTNGVKGKGEFCEEELETAITIRCSRVHDVFRYSI